MCSAGRVLSARVARFREVLVVPRVGPTSAPLGGASQALAGRAGSAIGWLIWPARIGLAAVFGVGGAFLLHLAAWATSGNGFAWLFGVVPLGLAGAAGLWTSVSFLRGRSGESDQKALVLAGYLLVVVSAVVISMAVWA